MPVGQAVAISIGIEAIRSTPISYEIGNISIILLGFLKFYNF